MELIWTETVDQDGQAYWTSEIAKGSKRLRFVVLKLDVPLREREYLVRPTIDHGYGSIEANGTYCMTLERAKAAAQRRAAMFGF